jgi:hypothetical protein
MQGSKSLSLIIVALAATGCSSNSLMKPDCHSCTVEEQAWKDFSWNDLLGKWRGSVENMKNEQATAKKSKTDKKAELNFVKASDFLQAWGGECKGLPENALVLNGVLWEGGVGAKEYEAFVPVEDDRVAYGRVSFNKINGQGVCRFRRLGRVMGKNRLNLPAVSFSDKAVAPSRDVASAGGASDDISVEFLRFATTEKTDKVVKAFTADGRKPASVGEQERPSLILRVFKISTKANSARGQWTGTDEYIYRLWKAN